MIVFGVKNRQRLIFFYGKADSDPPPKGLRQIETLKPGEAIERT